MSTPELVVDNEAEIREEALAWPDRARALRIVDAGTYTQAAGLLQGIKALGTKIDNACDPNIARWHSGHKAAVADKVTLKAPLAEAEGIIKRGLIGFDTEQERIRQAEQRRLEEEARKREAQRRLEEAAALEAQAVETGNADLMAEAQEIMAAPVVVAPVIVAKETPKVSGISMRENWKGDCTSLLALVKHCVEHPEDLNLVQPNATAIDQLARMRKANCKVPGIKVWNDPIMSASAR